MKSLIVVLFALAGETLLTTFCFADDADGYYQLGISKHQEGMLKEAVRFYTKAIEVDDRHIMAYQMRAAAWQQQRKYDKAIQDYSMVIVLGERNFQSTAYFNRGIVENMTGRYLEAVADFSKAIALNGKMGEAFFHRGIAKSRTGDMSGNLEDFIKAAKLGDPDAEGLLNRSFPGWKQVGKPVATEVPLSPPAAATAR